MTTEFFQQTNASQHEDYKIDEDRISSSAHVKVARVPQKAKRQEVAFLAQHSLLEPVLECCHFLCKAPQQPKGSVGRLFLGRLDLHKTYFDKFLEHECFAQASHCGFGTKTQTNFECQEVWSHTTSDLSLSGAQRGANQSAESAKKEA